MLQIKYKSYFRPILSARSDRSDKSVKEQQQKKISSLEKEVSQLKEDLQRQIAVNELHKTKISENFDKWKQQKDMQQTIEKLKRKLKEKEESFEKIQETCKGYRILIERSQREKHNLENEIKNLRAANPLKNNTQLELLKSEKAKLQAQVDVLNSKLEGHQQYPGGLGVAMMQEKMESQERKIAILELSAKVSMYIHTGNYLL